MSIAESNLNKRVLEKLRESYETERLNSAINQFDQIRGIVDVENDEGAALRNDLFKLQRGTSYLINDNYFFEMPRENLADLAHDIEDRMFEIIEAAESVRNAIEPLLSLGIEDGFETDADLENLCNEERESFDEI